MGFEIGLEIEAKKEGSQQSCEQWPKGYFKCVLFVCLLAGEPRQTDKAVAHFGSLYFGVSVCVCVCGDVFVFSLWAKDYTLLVNIYIFVFICVESLVRPQFGAISDDPSSGGVI